MKKLLFVLIIITGLFGSDIYILEYNPSHFASLPQEIQRRLMRRQIPEEKLHIERYEY